MIFGRNRKVVAKFLLRNYFESWHSANLQFKLICYVSMTYCLPLPKYVSLYRSHNLTSVFTKIQLSFKSHDAGTKLKIVFYILLLVNQ